jgi:DNA-binding transcriptional LysR family regulator
VTLVDRLRGVAVTRRSAVQLPAVTNRRTEARVKSSANGSRGVCPGDGAPSLWHIGAVDTDELRAFVAVVETGSVLAAARSLRFARATLRRRIDELEARAGVPLLIRHEQGMVPTAAGALLAEKARVILRDVGSLIAEVRENSAADAPVHLRLVCPFMPTSVSAMAISAVKTRFPDLSLELRFHDDPLSMLNDVDVAIYFGPDEPTGVWRSVEVARARVQLMASAEYLAEHGTPTSIDDLKRHSLALWQEPNAGEQSLPLLDGTAVGVSPFFTASDPFLLHRLAAQGTCIALVPYSEIFEGLDGIGPRQAVMADVVGRDLSARIAMPAALAALPRIKVIYDEFLRALGLPLP